MEPVKHLSCSLLQKKVNGLQPKIISAKQSTLDVWEGPSYPIINTSSKSKDRMQNTSPLFKNSFTSPYNKFTENTDI